MRRVDLSKLKDVEGPTQRIGWDDPNAKEIVCDKCNLLQGVPGRIYGVAMDWCKCGLKRNDHRDI